MQHCSWSAAVGPTPPGMEQASLEDAGSEAVMACALFPLLACDCVGPTAGGRVGG